MTVDFSNPCAVLDKLKQAHFDLITGKSVASVTHEGRTVTYSRGEIAALDQQIARYEALCSAASGQKARRFALRAGGI